MLEVYGSCHGRQALAQTWTPRHCVTAGLVHEAGRGVMNGAHEHGLGGRLIARKALAEVHQRLQVRQEAFQAAQEADGQRVARAAHQLLHILPALQLISEMPSSTVSAHQVLYGCLCDA